MFLSFCLLVASIVLFSSCAVCAAILRTNPDVVVQFSVGLKWDLLPNVGPKGGGIICVCFATSCSKTQQKGGLDGAVFWSFGLQFFRNSRLESANLWPHFWSMILMSFVALLWFMFSSFVHSFSSITSAVCRRNRPPRWSCFQAFCKHGFVTVLFASLVVTHL